MLLLTFEFETAPPKIFPAEIGGLEADELVFDEIPKPPNDNDALSSALAPKIFVPGVVCAASVSADFTPNKLVVVLVVWGVLALRFNKNIQNLKFKKSLEKIE